MKLNHIERHPHHSNYQISDGTYLYIYQKDAVVTIMKDYKSKTKNDDIVNILKIPTGDGKSFISEKVVEEVLDCVKPSYDSTEYKTVFLCCPLKEVLADMKEMMLSLEKSRDDIVLYFDEEERNIQTIKSYNKNKSVPAHKIFIFSDQWAEHNHNLLPNECDLLLRDEAKGVNASSEQESRDYLGDYKWGGKWYGRLLSYGGYFLLLNATPTDSHLNSKSFNILDIDVKPNLWKKPFLNESHGLDAEMRTDKERVVENLCYDFLQKIIPYRYKVDLIDSEKLKKHKKKTVLIKCGTQNAYEGLLTWQVKDIIEKYNEKLTGTVFTFTDPRTKEVIKHIYEGDLLIPIIKDKDNPGQLKQINSSLSDENILIVCELGTYGVNIKNLSHLCLLRDSQGQHIGKTYTAEQLFGRLKRNLWNDWIFMVDAMIDSKIDLKDYEWVRDTFIDVASKNLWYLKTDVNNAAFANFSSEMPNRTEIVNTVDDLVDGLFNWSPEDKEMMDSTGDSEDRNYVNVRNANCDSCDNSIFDVHYEKLIERGYSKVTASSYAIKDVIQNGHTHTRDDGTQRSICFSCHVIETREKEHWRKSDDPKRKTADTTNKEG